MFTSLEKIYPPNLQHGDEIRVIAPARSLALIPSECRNIAEKTFEFLGLKLSFSEFVMEKDMFDSSTIAHRVSDLHVAFKDPQVKGVISVLGGYNSNQLLPYIDWDVIKNNPKVFCGYSDITVLNNAMLAKTGLVTYSGPHYSTFGEKHHLGYTLQCFQKCLFSKDVFTISPSQFWTDDLWYINQEERRLKENSGIWVLQAGKGEGTILGGNLCSMNLLQGTDFFPQVNYPTLLFIEDTTTPSVFDRDLQSLLQGMSTKYIVGVVIGRFQEQCGMTKEKLAAIIKAKSELRDKPVIANLDFGHSDPKITFPIGGVASLKVDKNNLQFDILQH